MVALPGGILADGERSGDARPQSSLRDSNDISRRGPSTEVLGYSRVSLRDTGMPCDPAQTGMQPSTLTLPHTGGSEQERKDKPPEVVSGGWGNGGEMLDGILEGLELHASVVCLPGDAGRWRVGRSMSGG